MQRADRGATTGVDHPDAARDRAAGDRRAARRRYHPVAHFLLEHRTEIGSAGATCLVFLIFWSLNHNFLSVINLGGILTVAAELGFLSIGSGVLMIAAEIDISIASVFTMAGIIMAELLNHGWPDLAALAVVLLFGLIAGAINAAATLAVEIPSLIVTLGTLALWTGLSIAVSGGSSIYLPNPDRILDLAAGWTVGPSTLHISVFWWVGLCLVVYLVLQRSAFGNWVYATGGNAAAARAAGVPALRVKSACFLLCSVLAALAGVISLGRNSLMSPVVTANNLEAIAAAVIGGVSIWGGVGSVVGIMLGTIALSSIDIGLVAAGAPAFSYQALVGVVIIVIVMLNKYIDAAILHRIRS